LLFAISTIRPEDTIKLYQGFRKVNCVAKYYGVPNAYTLPTRCYESTVSLSPDPSDQGKRKK
jgi:hypothetical protein